VADLTKMKKYAGQCSSYHRTTKALYNSMKILVHLLGFWVLTKGTAFVCCPKNYMVFTLKKKHWLGILILHIMSYFETNIYF